MNDFTSLPLIPQLQTNLAGLGYVTPTPIQAQAIPPLLEGRDLLGIAQTGTGKTAAFSLPLLNQLSLNKSKVWPTKCRSLILAPTRELASQIQKDIKGYAQGLGLSVVVVFGGVKQGNQVTAMKRGADILIATPGRLEDLIQQGYIRLDQVRTVILDEADRMFDMGFVVAIRRIMAQLPKERQTLLFSATMPLAITKLANEHLTNPLRIEVTPESTTVERIRQQVLHVEERHKLALLMQILERSEVGQAMVFSRTKHGAERLMKNLKKEDFSVESLHGNKSQNARSRTLNAFRGGDLKILVATDIAARGLDVDGVSHVINYDLPMEPESYVHRIGRTGRNGRDGVAISFCSPEENVRLHQIERNIQGRLPVGNTTTLDWSESQLLPLDAKHASALGVPKSAKRPEGNSRPRRGKPAGDRHVVTGDRPKHESAKPWHGDDKARKPQEGKRHHSAKPAAKSGGNTGAAQAQPQGGNQGVKRRDWSRREVRR